MKKTLFSIFAFAALLSAAGCEKQETEPAEEPSIQLTQTSISVSNEENTINIGYRISNPVETGRINTESSVDWIHDLAEVDGNTTSAIVDANPEFSERTGKITVSYIYIWRRPFRRGRADSNPISRRSGPFTRTRFPGPGFL